MRVSIEFELSNSSRDLLLFRIELSMCAFNFTSRDYEFEGSHLGLALDSTFKSSSLADLS